MRAAPHQSIAGRKPWPNAWRRPRAHLGSRARASARDESDQRPSPLPLSPLAGALVAGATLGPLLDGIHSSVQLQVYDLWPLDLGPLHTSYTVPPLLASFYATVVLLDGAAERLSAAAANDNDNDTTTPKPPTPLAIAACYASLAGGLALSAFLHANQVPPPTIALALAAFSAFNFCAFDRTRRGLALALLCAVVAPLAEAQLMARFGTWHYPRGDIQVPVLLSALSFAPASSSAVPFPSWVPLCYFFYTPSVLLLGRRLRAAERQRKRREG